jgi:hypothetical protein
MPTISQKIWELNGAAGNVNDTAKKYFTDKILPCGGFSPKGASLGKFEILFPRIDLEKK